jgi:nicotinamide-nucleotide amidase
MNKACIVSIGNELLSGQTVDTNASWLAARLLERGGLTAGIWLVPDEKQRIVTAIQDASQQGELIFITGGLGPTDDDLTRDAVAAYLGVELEFHPEILSEIEGFFRKRGKKMAPKNRSQAYIPAGAKMLDNPIGTAPGFRARKNDHDVVVMPGVPAEMKQMFTDHVLPAIEQSLSTARVVCRKLRCFGAGESEIAQKLGDLMERGRNPLINCTCGSGEIILHINAISEDKTTALKMLNDDTAAIKQSLGDVVYGEDDQSLPEVVGHVLKKRHKTIVTAESCTGGLLSQMLTEIPGSSEYMLAGWVTYSNDAKIRMLGVPEKIMADFGAVSGPVARSMAVQAAQRSGADIAVAITGIAGPDGGTDEKPVGLVYISVLIDGDCHVQEHRFPAINRHWVRLRSALTALNCIRLRLQV